MDFRLGHVSTYLGFVARGPISILNLVWPRARHHFLQGPGWGLREAGYERLMDTSKSTGPAYCVGYILVFNDVSDPGSLKPLIAFQATG